VAHFWGDFQVIIKKLLAELETRNQAKAAKNEA
jgi:hypothetical protein